MQGIGENPDPGLHPRGIGRPTLERQRGIDKYNVTNVYRPALHIAKECVLQRLRARVADKPMRVPEQHVHDVHIALSAALGVSRVSLSGHLRNWEPPWLPAAFRQRTGVIPALIRIGHSMPTCRNPGPATGGWVSKASNGIDTLVKDSEFLGHKTHNKPEMGGLILGLHRALSAGITAICIRVYSQLIIAHITGCARCTTSSVSPPLDRALRLMNPRSFPHGIDMQWVRRNCNTEADASANAGLRARNQERQILFYDN